MTLRQTIHILVLLLAGHTLYGQTMQGYIDYDKVVVTFSQYATGQKTLETRRKQLSDSITTFVNEFQRTLRESPHNEKMDSASKVLLEGTLIKLQKKIEDAQNRAQNELKKTQETIEIKLKDIVTKDLKIYCANKDIICIADHKSILYCKDCVDFTDDFVKYLKKRVE